MKIRQGFVSNSSSSSFIIGKSNLTVAQLDAIKNHHMHVEKSYDTWSITEEDDLVKGSTDMDNFDMNIFLEKIGIDEEKIHWSD